MEESKKKKIRFGYIDLLETIAIICIVFYHGAIGNEMQSFDGSGLFAK